MTRFALLTAAAVLCGAASLGGTPASAAPMGPVQVDTASNVTQVRSGRYRYGRVKRGRYGRYVRRDRQGRDLRSSTRGNAGFPARPPAAQNLGQTSGGPRF